ncbi:MAG: hypothetical protein PHO53_00255 [Actinomycetota bacterium]|nr:hypothetical protein [Actinomycetota bacterium]
MWSGNSCSKKNQAFRLLACLACASLLLLPLYGCGGGGPEGAVRRYLEAWERLDWEAYKNSVAPGRKLTPEEEELARQKFKQVKIKTSDLKMKTTYSKDKKQAEVVISQGKITYTANVLGTKKTEVQDIGKMKEEEKPTFKVVLVNGNWYVDIELG